MIDHLIACGFHHLFGPIRNVTKVQFNHIPACLADDMVVVILQLTKLISDIRPVDDFENKPQRFEEFKRPIDRGQSDFLLLFEEVLINFQGTQRR
jgi:hypothetical protein